MKVSTEKELGKAIRDGADTIEIEGDLSKKVIRIKAKGKVAWAIAFGAIGVAVVATLAAPPSGGATFVAHCVAAPAAASVLGVSVTSSAIAIAVAAGSVGALSRLRKYRLNKRPDGSVVLRK